MKRIVKLDEAEACALIATALEAQDGKPYTVEAFIERGYEGNALDHCPASVRFEATEGKKP